MSSGSREHLPLQLICLGGQGLCRRPESGDDSFWSCPHCCYWLVDLGASRFVWRSWLVGCYWFGIRWCCRGLRWLIRRHWSLIGTGCGIVRFVSARVWPDCSARHVRRLFALSSLRASSFALRVSGFRGRRVHALRDVFLVVLVGDASYLLSC